MRVVSTEAEPSCLSCVSQIPDCSPPLKERSKTACGLFCVPHMVPGTETWSFTGKQIVFYICFTLKYITQMWQKRRANTGNWEMAKNIEGCLGGDRGVLKAGEGSGSAWCTGKGIRLGSRSRLSLSGNTLLV